ncbi:hypothetical protein LJB42_000029 [Komagataella kurtzmanii]|nr:hypothetical protein LJB42_000029 [Komagataella kurtzmanii]
MSLKNSTRVNSPLSNSSGNSETLAGDSRSRQCKKDDAIRRRIEQGLKKRTSRPTGSTSPTRNVNGILSSPLKRNKTLSRNKYEPGTVMALKPSEPIICKPNYTVHEAAQLMGFKKENCILVVDENDELTGIFTAKDLAFRIVGSGLRANSTTVDAIMTPSPLCCKTTTKASEALNLMVTKGFRHLPIVDDTNQIVGILDITKCYNEAMSKLERMYESSKKLYDALEGVNLELQAQQPLEVIQYFENLKRMIDGPNLSTVLDDTTSPVYVDVKSTVQEAASLMRDNRTTAVLVQDSNNDNEVTGIFTSKDVVLRVIAADLNPRNCSVIRVMTPKPDYATSELSVHEALRKMFEGRYLNLPIIDPLSTEIIGIVGVLKLTHVTLSQIKTMQTKIGTSSSVETVNSGFGSPDETQGPAWNKFWTSLDQEDSESLHSLNSDTQSPFEVTSSEMQQFPLDHEIQPSDSVSFSGNSHSRTLNVDYNSPFSFKLRTPVGRTHRVSLKPMEGICQLRSIISSKFNNIERQLLIAEDAFAISYIDDEGDLISVTTDQDLLDCVYISKLDHKEKVDLLIHKPDDTPDTLLNGLPRTKTEYTAEFVKGVPNEILLPGAIFALAASIVAIFTLARNK